MVVLINNISTAPNDFHSLAFLARAGQFQGRRLAQPSRRRGRSLRVDLSFEGNRRMVRAMEDFQSMAFSRN